jgi:spore germination protein (amino acid permease)
MTTDNDKISSFQVGVFVLNTILGVGILTLPASLTKEVGSDAWLLSIISGFINVPFLYFICKVGEKYGEKGFLGTLKSLFGRFLGTLLSLPVLVYFVVFSGLVVRIFAETIKLFLLNNTPLEFIIIPLLILAIFLARSGVEPIARFFEAVTPIIVVIFVGLIIIAVPNSKEITNLRPYLTTPVMKYITGLKTGIFSFAGFEILMILYPFFRKPKGAFKASIISLPAVIVIYTVIIIECISKFGQKKTKVLIYPTMTLIKSSEIPGAFIEGMEGFLISMWVLFVFTTLVSLLYGFSVVGGDLLKHKERKHVIPLFLPVMYLIALLGDNVAQLFKLIDKLSLYLGGYVIIILPTIMFIMMHIKRKKGRKKADNRSKGGSESEG